MSNFSYTELLEVSGGSPLSEYKPFESARLWTDTRTLQFGDFFLPLSGENFDGHTYLESAFASGALGAFVQQEKAQAHLEWQKWPNLIAVADPLAAYLAVARYHREKMNPLVIAVTGSSGKTTTKEMLYAALSPLKKTVKTEKNFNNEVGVCQTLLALQPGTEVLVVEMGMRGLRQISILSQAARPNIALIVNVGQAHIGMLGSLENIARAKLEITEGMEPDQGILVLNGDNPLLTQLAPTLWTGRTEPYSIKEAQDIEPYSLNGNNGPTGVQFSYQGVKVRIPVPGEHMVSNALGVLKIGQALRLNLQDLAQGLTQFMPEKGRWERKALEGYANVWIINDAYNANPDSAMASIKAFLATANQQQRHILVLGGMKELGDFTQEYHEKLGRWLAAQPAVDALFTVGEEARWIAEAAQNAQFPVRYAETIAHLTQQLAHGSIPLEDVVIYLKGSRAYRLDEIPAALSQLNQQSTEGARP